MTEGMNMINHRETRTSNVRSSLFRRLERFYADFILIGVGGVIAMIFVELLSFNEGIWLYEIKIHVNIVVFEVGVAVFTLVVSGILYRIRNVHPRFYGTLESAVGFSSCILAANQFYYNLESHTLIFAFFSELAALYIIVRGFENIHRSLVDPEKRRRWEVFFFDRELPSSR
jgi:hypothetical protein